MKVRLTTVFVMIAVALSIGFMAGRFAGPISVSATSGRSALAPAEQLLPSLPTGPRQLLESDVAEEATEAVIAPGDDLENEAKVAGDLEQRVSELLETADLLARVQGWTALLEELELEQFPEVMVALRARTLAEGSREEHQWVLAAWAKRDPRAAIDFVLAESDAERDWETVMRSWGAHNPNSALVWIRTTDAEIDANDRTVDVILGMATKDLYAATRQAAELASNKMGGQAVNAMAAGLLETALLGGVAEAEAWTASAPPRLRSVAVVELSKKLGREDPPAAVEFLKPYAALGNAEVSTWAIGTAAREVFADWAAVDAAAAIAAHKEFPKGFLRDGALAAIVYRVSQDDLELASKIFAEFEAEAGDGSRRWMVIATQREKPEQAFRYASGISNANLQLQSYKKIVDNMLREKRELLASMLADKRIPAEVVDYAEQQLAKAKAKSAAKQ